jgi:hypothetical protein
VRNLAEGHPVGRDGDAYRADRRVHQARGDGERPPADAPFCARFAACQPVNRRLVSWRLVNLRLVNWPLVKVELVDCELVNGLCDGIYGQRDSIDVIPSLWI